MDNKEAGPYHVHGFSTTHALTESALKSAVGDVAMISRLLLVGFVTLGVLVTGAAFAADPAPVATPPGAAPAPVNTQDHPDALILNTRNPLVIHAGPGKPNVGHVFVPPSLFGKDKGKGQKAGQTEQTVMGATPK